MESWEFGRSYATATHKTIFKSFQIDEIMFFFRKKIFKKKQRKNKEKKKRTREEITVPRQIIH